MDDLRRYLIEAHDKSEWICEILGIFRVCVDLTILILSGISVYICWLKNDDFNFHQGFHPIFVKM